MKSAEYETTGKRDMPHEPRGAVQRPAASLVKTCLLFGLFMGIFHLTLWFAMPADTDPLRESTIRIVSGLLKRINVENSVDATYIMLKNKTWIITPECTAINVFILFVSFVLSYTSSARAKLVALAVGMPFIFAANIARLVFLGWVTEHAPHYARFTHDYAWQALFLILVVAMWLAWIELVVNREENPVLPR
ncbi:hypothetical protein F6V30_10230 [Oryzomonas sagensis]|uniref:Exosortase H n=1 Tax=Oryzomonas sagensis TaxID=2603857 RepID=A0ABQ6TPJ9_9BACT|nr:exosortase/archaeosortase family protein [Oryzomonas sagensis]KAB0670509.1 hypothetical protein F6V30_10230 [Oryzomonas sagensis]